MRYWGLSVSSIARRPYYKEMLKACPLFGFDHLFCSETPIIKEMLYGRALHPGQDAEPGAGGIPGRQLGDLARHLRSSVGFVTEQDVNSGE